MLLDTLVELPQVNNNSKLGAVPEFRTGKIFASKIRNMTNIENQQKFSDFIYINKPYIFRFDSLRLINLR